jgi:hypothetical protein
MSLRLTNPTITSELGHDIAEDDTVERAILHALAYADIFDFPLTAREIHHYLIRVAAPMEAVAALLDNGRLVPERVTYHGGYFALQGRESLVEVRLHRAATANRLWPHARRYARLIASLPFVRMAALTGALAVDNVEPGADLDYLVITVPGRLWLCRALVVLLVRWAARRGHTICPNYFLSQNAMVFQDRNLYTAHELVQMVPLAGLPLYWRLREINSWVHRFLPNAQQPLRNIHSSAPKSRLVCTAAETVLRSPPGGWLERWEMTRKVAKFSMQDGPLDEVAFCEDWCKGHFDAHGGRTLDAFAQRLQALEL